MELPFVTLVSQAIRNDRYKITLDSLSKKCRVGFEVIFVGNKNPLEKMPDNFRYIYTDVKPSQCLEIAVRNAKTPYVIPIADDLTFSDDFLNKMYLYSRRTEGRKMIISSRYSLKGEMKDEWLFYDINKPTSPVLGSSCSLYNRDMWLKLGGLDSRFVCTYSEIDMKMRFFEQGYTIFITPDCIMNEEIKGGDISASQKSSHTDRKMLDSLWVKNDGSISKTRLFPIVGSFSDLNILEKSQGNNISSGKGGEFRWI